MLMRRTTFSILFGLFALAAPLAAQASAPPKPKTEQVKPPHRAKRPVKAAKAPDGASAQCRDGTYSFSAHRRGTCSHHHGVATWLKPLP